MELTGYLDFWFRDLPIVERIQHFERLGIHRLDVWLWRERPMAEIYAECKQRGMIINSTFDGECGNLVDATDHDRVLAAWEQSLEAAVKYEIPHLFIFSNQIDVSAKGEWIQPLNRDYTAGEMYANLLDGVEKVMKLVKQTKVQLWFEALNTFHIHGGVFVCTHDLAADVVRRFDDPQLRLSFDCYHQQRTAGNLIWGMEEYYGLYPTFHIGDCPTRQEPGTGEINFTNISQKLDELDYDGLIGLECYPSTTEEDALARIRSFFPRAK
jgi:hydroxypyruvate isomerase